MPKRMKTNRKVAFKTAFKMAKLTELNAGLFLERPRAFRWRVQNPKMLTHGKGYAIMSFEPQKPASPLAMPRCIAAHLT
jgi:hypothetical protein